MAMWDVMPWAIRDDPDIPVIPLSRFHQHHLNKGGVLAPNGKVTVFLKWPTGTPPRPWVVEVVAHAGGDRVLARGEVIASSEEREYDLPMIGPYPLSMVKVVLRFRCGDLAPASQGYPSTVFVVNNPYAGEVTPR